MVAMLIDSIFIIYQNPCELGVNKKMISVNNEQEKQLLNANQPFFALVSESQIISLRESS